MNNFFGYRYNNHHNFNPYKKDIFYFVELFSDPFSIKKKAHNFKFKAKSKNIFSKVSEQQSLFHKK